MPARELPLVSEEDMQRILRIKSLHPSWIAPLMEAYSHGLIRGFKGRVLFYDAALDKLHIVLWVAGANYVPAVFRAPYKGDTI